jgi:hypothetical protein
MSGIENSENGGPENKQEIKLPVFVNEQIARVLVPGSVSNRVQGRAPNLESKLQEILDKIKDPNYSVVEVTHLIAVEMILIVQDMQTCERDGAAAFRRESYMAQIGALRALDKAVKEADVGRKRADVLNFDGPKFKFVFGEMGVLFKKAAEAAIKDDESLVKSIMLHFCDIVREHEPELRRETEKICYSRDHQPTGNQSLTNLINI